MKNIIFTLKKVTGLLLRTGDNKRMQSIDSIEAYTYGTSKDLVSEKEGIWCNDMTMINFDDVRKESIKEHNTNWLQFPDHPYRIIIIGSSASGKFII